MTTPQISEANIFTGETILRDMNAVELAQYKADQDESKADAQVRADKVIAKQAVLTKLGLTADEVAALLS